MTFKRKIYDKLLDHLSRKEFTIITGARQTGKTTLLKQINEYLVLENAAVYFLTLEDISILNELNNHPENIFRFIVKKEGEKNYLLIDEIQYLNNPSNFLKLLFDKYSEELKIIATGSSAFYIDQNFKDSLAGRKRIFELYTLDFDEYLLFRKLDTTLLKELKSIRENPEYISLKRNELQQHFNDYLIYGSFPAVVLADSKEEKTDLLKELFTSYLKKDVLEAGIQHHDKFFNLLTLLAHQTGSLLNVNELSNTLGLSTTSVNHYLYVLSKSFQIQTIRPFFENIRKELTKMPKLYFNDTGFRNIIMNNFSSLEYRPDKGAIVENYIYIRLRELYGKDSINFWRTADGNEIDFIYTVNDQRFALEAKYNHKEYRPLSYKKFAHAYPDIHINCRAFLADSNKHNIIGF